MSSTTLAYYKLKPSPTIRKRPPRALHSDTERGALFPRAGSTASNLARLLLTALILLLTATAQAQRGAAETHIVQPGETLGRIAQNYGVDIDTLASTNGISNAHVIHSWQELTIPTGANPQAAAAGATHIVRHGETLDSIAKLYGIALSDLRALNNIRGWIFPSDELTLPAAGRAPAPTAPSSAPARQAPAPAAQPETHIVQRGETLFRIAQRYGLPLDSLLSANNIEDPRRIHAGLRLRLNGLASVAPPASSAQPAPAPASGAQPAPAPEESRRRYLVRPGDSLSEIGARLNMSWRAIADVNGIADPNSVKAGAALLLPTLAEMARYSPNNPNAREYFYGIPSDPGPRVGVGREIVIVLSTQTAYAYENGILKKRALISSGLPETSTVKGDFKVYRKIRSQTMDGPGYYLENVEWVMYFKWEYAIHGTYWHYNFGQPMSHGCVNMTNADAKWFYEFASVGTPVHVRD